MAKIFPKEFEEKKKKIKILILGAYKPPSFKQRLQTLKERLRKEKYENTNLVADFPDEPRFDADPDIHFSLKSREYIRYWADAIIFVFFNKADNSGVATEFEFACQKVREKLATCVVFNEKKLKLSTLIKGPIKIHKIDADEFANDAELCDKASAYCIDIVLRLYYSI